MKVFYAVAIAVAVATVGFSSSMLWASMHGRDLSSAAGRKNGGESANVYYEIFVRSFYDTNGDGIGDLNGVTAKLDYLQSLGVSGIWLMPINPSPSYHGYDVTDYYGIQPQYGTMADFQNLLKEAHKRGIRVIMDLVLNHTSNRHPWFQQASGGSAPYRDWYVWADSGTDVNAVSAAGGPAWHAALGDSYLGIFSDSMPDLNYDNPEVRREMTNVGRFWLKQGVDGFRLDAAKHIYDNLQTDDNLPETVQKNLAWWDAFRQGLDQVNPEAYVVGEVWDNSFAGMAPYLEAFDSVFDFPLAGTLIDSVKNEQSANIGDTLSKVYALYQKESGGKFVDAPFLSNHDQDRVMSQLDGNPNHMKMAAALLLTLPGEPFIYYGEEIGMRGQKPDEQIREPMRWNEKWDAPGETAWERPALNSDPQVSVEAEQKDPDSLLHTYQMLIRWRKQVEALRNGAIRDYPADGGPISAYVRASAQQTVLVAHNLSGAQQTVSLDPNLPDRFAQVLLASQDGVDLQGGRLTLPPYSTAVLQ
jgi:glycosidase